MYEIIPLICGIVIFILGLLMTIMPKQMTKKQMRDNPAAVAKVRKGGIVELICGVILIIVELTRFI